MRASFITRELLKLNLELEYIQFHIFFPSYASDAHMCIGKDLQNNSLDLTCCVMLQSAFLFFPPVLVCAHSFLCIGPSSQQKSLRRTPKTFEKETLANACRVSSTAETKLGDFQEKLKRAPSETSLKVIFTFLLCLKMK